MDDLERLNFLLVEDDDIDAENIERGFKENGFSNPLIRAEDGIEALTFLRSSGGKTKDRSFAIILDLNMPRMGGLEFLKELRSDSKLKDTPVYVLTSSDNCKDVAEAHKWNCAGYLLKPLDRGQLIKVLEKMRAFLELCIFPEGKLLTK